MSVRVMSLCYDARFGSANRKAVAVALADHANDQGADVYPSVARLVAKTELSERTVQRILRELEKIGIIVKDAAGGEKGLPKSTNEWHFDLTLLRNIVDGKCEISETETGVTVTPIDPGPVSAETGPVSGATSTGVTVTPEPSLTVINHPGASARATEEGRASPTPKSHPAERLVLRTDPEWVEWFALYERLDGKRFVDAFSSQDGMIVYAAKPHKAADPPGLLVTNGKTWQRLMAEREAKEAARVLTAKSKAMTGEAA